MELSWREKMIKIMGCKQTKDVRNEFKNFSENKELLSDSLIEDLLDESNLYDPSYNNKTRFNNYKPKIRIGNKYQVAIPTISTIPAIPAIPAIPLAVGNNSSDVGVRGEA